MNEVVKIKIANIDTFKNHPFLVNNDDSLLELAQSIKNNVSELKNIQFNNEFLKNNVRNILDVLLVYDDLSNEEKAKVKEEIIYNFLNIN